MILDHLPVLQIVVPLLAAPLCVLVRERALVLSCALAVCWSAFAGSLVLLAQTLKHRVITYEMGNWPAPYGIEYRLDSLNTLVLVFVTAMAALVLTYAPASVKHEIPRNRHYLFYATYLLCLTGLSGIAITGDLFNLFVFLEISSLSSYALISLGQHRRALLAAFQYLIMGTIGATFLLIGIGLIYQLTGSLNMSDIAAHLQTYSGPRTVVVAFAFVSVGLSIKMALFPLHRWLPNAYAYAPSVVSCFIAATSTKVSVYVLLRMVFTIFKPGFAFRTLQLDSGLMILSLLGIMATSFAAIYQDNLKRMLAYSSVSQIGYIVLGISLASPHGLTAAIVHMFNHALIKGGLFMCLGCFALRVGMPTLDKLQGISHRMPYTALAWSLGGLALIGVPLTAGFVGKWYLLLATFESNYWWVAIFILASSLLSLWYVWRVVEAIYFGEPPANSEEIKEAPWSMLIPLFVVILATFVFGIWTPFSAGLARDAASLLLEGTMTP